MFVREALLSDPLIVAPDTTVLDFCERVLHSNQTTAVVIDDRRKLLGMLSVHDVFARIVPHYVDMESKLADVIHEGYFEEKFDAAKRTSVAALMVTDVHVLSPDDSVIKAIALFSSANHKTAPVVENGEFVGTITRRSVLRAVTDALR